MAEYIDRIAAAKEILAGEIEITAYNNDSFPQEAVECYRAVVLKYLLSLPAADVRKNVRGEWFDRGSLSCRCSACGLKNRSETNFCPNCGADMRVEDDR